MNTTQRFAKVLASALAFAIICGLIGGAAELISFFGGFGSMRGKSTDEKTYDASVTVLDIDLKSANIRIASGGSAGGAITVNTTDPHISVRQRGSTLFIVRSRSFWRDNTIPAVTVVVPRDHALSAITIAARSGSTQISGVTSDRLSLDTNAGSVTLDGVTILKKAEIKTKKGSISASEGLLTDAVIKTSYGGATLSCAFAGDSEIRLGTGDSAITLPGAMDDYTLDINKGLGDLIVGGKQVRQDSTFGAGEVEIEIVHNTGDLTVSYSAQTQENAA